MPKTFWEIWVDVRLGLVHDELPTAYVYKRLRCLWTESWQSFVFVKEKRKKSNISCCKSIPRKISLSRRPWNKWCCVNPSRQTILLWSLIIISILSEIRCFLDIYRKPGFFTNYCSIAQKGGKQSLVIYFQYIFSNNGKESHFISV